MRTTLALALICLAPATVQAQKLDLRGGLYTGLSLPVGDLYSKESIGTNRFFGSHIGGHLDFNITPNHQVRGHVVYIDMPGATWEATKVTHDFDMLQLGADWVYNFQNPSMGWYSIAGVTVTRIRNDYSIELPGTVSIGTATQEGRFGLRGGAGYSFNKLFALEATLNHVEVEKDGADGFGFDTAQWLQVSAVFRWGGGK